MQRRATLLAVIGMLLFGRVRANTTPSDTRPTWEGIQREFARRHLSFRLLKHRHGTWDEIAEFFTDESREALSALTDHALPPTTAVDELLLFDARLSHCELLGITDRDTPWETICDEHLQQVSDRENEVDDYFLYPLLFAEQTRFWSERIERLFPHRAHDDAPLRPHDDTI